MYGGTEEIWPVVIATILSARSSLFLESLCPGSARSWVGTRTRLVAGSEV